MGGEHHEPKLPKVPDWRIYHVEDVPQLMAVRKALACHNLKDPWARNYVWRYLEYDNNPNNKGLLWLCKLGMKWGLPAAIISAVAHKAYLKYIEPQHVVSEHH